MNDVLRNPITMSLQLLEEYRALLRRTLLQTLSEDDADEILRDVQVDRSLFISVNRTYRQAKTSFRQFCMDHHLADRLADAFPNLNRLYVHQEKAILSILGGRPTIISTGTGSGKTEAFLIPILDHCLKNRTSGVKAIIIYPMNALANDQVRRLEQATRDTPITFRLFTGNTDEKVRNEIRRDPPDILVTNYVMLDWMLTRAADQPIFDASQDSLRYVVLDEIHTYRGSKATHLKYLLARLKARVTGPVVQVGTSATLQSETTPGYLYSPTDRLDRFVKPLLDVDSYEFIQPEYEPEDSEIHEDASELHFPDAGADFGWELNTDIETGLQRVGLLTGKGYSLMDIAPDDITQSRVFLDPQRHQFVRAMRALLIQKGAQSLLDLTRLLCNLLPPGYPSDQPEELVKAYLSAIAFVNHLAGRKGQPLLDFRVHLFLRDVGGYLKRCIKCGRYHSGNQEYCQECGFPLFYVYRHNIHQCIGKVSGNRLRWVLGRESDDRGDPYYVLISKADDEEPAKQPDSLRARDATNAHDDESTLEYDEYGTLRLTLLEMQRASEVMEHAIPLVDGVHRHQYIFALVNSILDFQPPASKKLLGFVDNREYASQYAVCVQDEFASRFFQEYLNLCLPAEREVNVLSALQILHRQMPAPEDLSQLEQDIFREMDLWYWRTIGMPSRLLETMPSLLRFRAEDVADLSDVEREILEIFLAERAIDKPPLENTAHTRFIKFQKEYGTDRRGIHCDPGAGSKDPRFPSLSLADQAEEYGWIVKKHGAERIRETIRRLVEKGWLTSGTTPDEKTHYYLNPERAYIQAPSPGKYHKYPELRRQCLLTAAVHSAEVKDPDRKQVEEGFQKGTLNFVLATPTLEMGIDIGELQTVLMVGVPPLPSNYAQRAGRAGRKHNDQFALVVTFCSDTSEHDRYYFQRPELMINGTISPPVFNPSNEEIIRKHVHAFMLSGRANDEGELQRFCADIDAHVDAEAATIRRVFGDGAYTYLQNGFRDHVRAAAHEALKSGLTPQQYFYRTGFFPDYSFRRDQVYLLDERDPCPPASEASLADIAISEREPELAYYKFSPEETLFIGGDIYKVLPEGEYTSIEAGTMPEMRAYRYLLASPRVRYATQHKEIRKYALDRLFDKNQQFVDKGRVLRVGFSPDTRLRFVNRGVKKAKGYTAFGGEDEQFALGYELNRQALVFQFDQTVCSEPQVYLSLISAVDRAVKECFGLDESEIRLIVDAKPLSADSAAEEYTYAVFYEADGSGSVPMAEIFGRLDEVLERAYATMVDCKDARGHPCEQGCYRCLRSYATHHFAGTVDKPTALMFVGYLLGKNPFRPSLAAPPPPDIDQVDLELRLERRDSEYIVHGPTRAYKATADGEEQNKVIFDLLRQAVQAEFTSGMKTLRILAREDYIVNAINGCSIKKNFPEFARLMFNLLRFRNVIAQKDVDR